VVGLRFEHVVCSVAVCSGVVGLRFEQADRSVAVDLRGECWVRGWGGLAGRGCVRVPWRRLAEARRLAILGLFPDLAQALGVPSCFPVGAAPLMVAAEFLTPG
jgi:hypothetical protein